MLSTITKSYIYGRARGLNMKVPPDIERILKEEISKYSEYNVKMKFSWAWDPNGKVPNASATIPGVILFNAEWAAMLVLFPDDLVVHNAFKLTIGHELTHQEGDFFFLEPFSKKQRFVNWVNEVHADYGGIQKMFLDDYFLAMRALKYKQSRKEKDIDTQSHPSWERRVKYVERALFDDGLVREIAATVGCDDQELINRVSSHFENIELRRCL